MQSKDIDGDSVKHVTSILLQVLQDDNFDVSNLDSDVGYFQANKKLDGGKEKYKFAWYDIYYPIAIYKYATLSNYVKEIKATVSVRKLGRDKLSVRVSFNVDIKDNDGKLISSNIIEDQKFYQEFFAKLDKAIFLEKNNL